MPFATDQERALAHLLVSVMNAKEQEGARVSRMLHDEVGQVLSAIGLQLDLLRMDLCDDPAVSRHRIGEIQALLEKAIGHVRDLSYELNPSVVERAGLQYALDKLVGRYRKDQSCVIRLLFDSSIHVPVQIATALYKIAEQALDNAARHSHARQVEIHVKSSRAGVTLEVRDDGEGFSLERSTAETPGLGLHLMRHYAERVGLRFSIASAPGKGTIIRAIHRVAPESA